MTESQTKSEYETNMKRRNTRDRAETQSARYSQECEWQMNEPKKKKHERR